MSLNDLFFGPEFLKKHRAAWYVWAEGIKMRRTAKMRGFLGYDVTCSCGWESRTGGATQTSVERELFSHRLGALADDGTRQYECTWCGARPGEHCTDGRQLIGWMHPARWKTAAEAQA